MYSIGSVIRPEAHAAWHFTPNVFTDEECDRILKIESEYQKVFYTDPPTGIKSTVEFFQIYANDHEWIFDKLSKVVNAANEAAWQFQIEGFFEDAYRMKFGLGAFEPWHYDIVANAGEIGVSALRKLTVEVQLSDPTTYGGCDFRPYGFDWDGWESRKVRGSVIVRPAFLMYETSQCYENERHILRTFVHGQHFK